MKSKINSSKKTPFLRRNNFAGILTNNQALELSEMITSVSKGNIAGNVRIYHTKGSGSAVKDLLKRFGNKYPYASITNYGAYITYDCKKKGSSKQKTQADNLIKELQSVINYGFSNRVKEESEILLRSDSDVSGNSSSFSNPEPSNTNNSTEETEDENAVISFVKNPVNIIIIIALLVGVYFLLKK